jgi:hypothetical protein
MASAVHYDWPSEGAANTLSAVEREKLHAALARLSVEDLRSNPAIRTLGQEGADEAYAMQMGRFVVVFAVRPGDEVVILDIINKKFAQRYG